VIAIVLVAGLSARQPLLTQLELVTQEKIGKVPYTLRVISTALININGSNLKIALQIKTSH
jgi:hypothetical protein